MKIAITLSAVIIFSACKNSSEKTVPVTADTSSVVSAKDTTPNFFPVTTYIKGEIADITKRGLTPVRKITGSKDSSFVQPGDFEKVFAEFTEPLIDTANLKSTFSEASFKDETLNAFTFTYDPIAGKENNFPFRHWDVYVDPETNKVTKVYLVKIRPDGTELHLYWQSGRSCKITAVKKDAVISEENISWTYE